MNNDIILHNDGSIEVKQIVDQLKDDTPEYLNINEIHHLLNVTAEKNNKHFMLICFLWNTGVRITEAIKVKKGNIDFSSKNIKILWLKRRKLQMRTIPVNDKFMYLLSTYTGQMNKDQYIFPYTRQRACQILTKYNEILNKTLHPHLFRHSFAVNYYLQTNDIVGLKDLLGHSNIRNTLIYAKISNSEIRGKLNSIDF